MWQGIRMRVAVAAAAVGVALVPALVGAQAGASQWRTALSGASEVPANNSAATGTFTATLDEAAGTLAWTLTVPSIQNATMAHLHNAAVLANGPVVLDLFIPGAGNTANAINASGTARVADLKGPLAGNFAGFVAALKAGTIYANVHTTAIPAGEIRGQVTNVAAQATPATAPAPGKTGTGGLAEGNGIAAGAGVLLASLVVGLALAGRRLTGRPVK